MALMVFGIIWIASKTAKRWGHFIQYPVDLLLLPVLVLFGYLHMFIKLHALLSLDVVSDHSISSIQLVLCSNHCSISVPKRTRISLALLASAGGQDAPQESFALHHSFE